MDGHRSVLRQPLSSAALGHADLIPAQFTGDFCAQVLGVIVTAQSCQVEPFVRLDEVEFDISSTAVLKAELEQRVGCAGLFGHVHGVVASGLEKGHP
jgi:hypothetical protein